MYEDPTYERIFKIGKVIPWIISINTEDDIKLFDVGDEVYLWWPSKERLDLPLVKEGIFSLAHIVTKPKEFLYKKNRSSNELIPMTANLQKLNDGDVVYNQKRMKGEHYYNKYKIELIIDKIKVDESFFDNSILNNDPVFSDLKLSPHDSCTYYLISENQSDKLKILLENPNFDQTALMEVQGLDNQSLIDEDLSPNDSTLAYPDYSPPGSVETKVIRTIRDTAMIRVIKAQFENHCAICNYAIQLPSDRFYSEGHHVRPLASFHEGPDVKQNILILCPTHHAEFDYGSIAIDPIKGKIVHLDPNNEYAGREPAYSLAHLDPEFLKYHFSVIFKGEK